MRSLPTMWPGSRDIPTWRERRRSRVYRSIGLSVYRPTTKGTSNSFRCALRQTDRPIDLLVEPLRDLRPVHSIPPGLQVIRPAVLVFEIVRVLPYVVAEDGGGLAVHEWVVLVGRARDGELAPLL